MIRFSAPLSATRALGALALFTQPVLAHHAGGIGNTGGAGPILTISASTLEQGHAVAGVVIDYTSLNTLSEGTLKQAVAGGVEGVHDLKTLQSYAFIAAYGVTNDLMLSLRLPYVKRTGIKAAEQDPGTGDIEVMDHGGSEGLGDLSVFGQYRFYNDRASRSEAALLFGVKAPTGTTGRLSRQGELLDAEFQPGSGSWDFSGGLALTHRVGQWSFDANVLYNAVTEGTQHTGLGDLLMYNFAVSYRLVGLSNAALPMFHGGHSHEDRDDGHHHAHGEPPADPRLDLVLEFNGQRHDKQVTAGITDQNSGADLIYLSPGLRLSVGNVSAFASIGIPLVDNFHGIQPDADWHVTTGLMVGF